MTAAVQKPDPGSFRELFAISLPLIISAGSHSVMSVADRVMLAGYSPADTGASTTLDIIAAVTPASMLHWTVACIPLGTIFYANTFIAQFDGAQKPGELCIAFWHAVMLSVVSGILLILFVPFSSALFSRVGHAPPVVVQETAYFNTLCLGSILILLSNALSCFFSGRRRTTVVMCVNVLSVVFNVIGDYGLIFGHWGLPELGITGAAVATLLARAFDVGIYFVLIWKESRRLNLPVFASWKPEREMLRRYLRYGLPSGFHFFIDNSGFLAFLLIVGSLSRDAMAATNLAFSVNSLIFVPLLGFGTAVQTIVGHHIGAGLLPAAIRTTWNAVRMGMVWTGAAAVFLVFFPELSLRPFMVFASGQHSLQSILPTTAQLLRFVAVYSVFDAMAVVFASALRGAGDTLFPMFLTMISSWLVMVLPSWLIVQSMSASVHLLWLTCTAHIVLMGVAMLVRFLTGRWKQIHLT